MVLVRTGKVRSFLSRKKSTRPPPGDGASVRSRSKKKKHRSSSHDPKVRIVKKDGVTFRYRTVEAPPQPTPRKRGVLSGPATPNARADSTEQLLRAVSADPGRLQIRSADPQSPRRTPSRSRRQSDLKSARQKVAEAFSPPVASPAIIGFDFGTAFTKVIVQWRDRHYPIDWSGAVETTDKFLLPTRFSEQSNGVMALGSGLSPSNGGRIVEGIKLRLLEWERAPTTSLPESAEDAVAIMALALRHTISTFEQIARKQRGAVSRWRLNVGLPAAPWESRPLRNLTEQIARGAFSVASVDVEVTRQVVKAALQGDAGAGSTPVSVVAEFAAQLASYLRSPKRESDIHGLVDIGAGTVDFVSFNAHAAGSKHILPIASSAVRPLGSHYLLGALAGKPGQDRVWNDQDAIRDDGFFAEQNQEQHCAVAHRRAVFGAAFRSCLNQMGEESIAWYPTSERFRSKPRKLPVFLCGGGSEISEYRTLLKTWCGLKVELRSLPVPEDMADTVDAARFHRLSVAYGLSLLQRNVAEVRGKAESERMEKPREIDFGDRDADR